MIERVHDAVQRVGVVENRGIGAEGRAVGDDVPAIERGRPAPGIQPIQRAGRMRLEIVHRAEPHTAIRSDARIVQPVLRSLRLDAGQVGEYTRWRIESVQAGLRADDKAPALEGEHETGLRRTLPCRLPLRSGVIAAHESTLDVDEPQRRVALHPDRALAQLGADRADVLRFEQSRPHVKNQRKLS